MTYRKVLFASPRVSDAGSISMNDEAASMPAANLLRQPPTDYAVSTNLTLNIDHVLPVDHPGWNFVALGRVNLEAGGTFCVDAAATEGGLSSPSYTSGTIAAPTAPSERLWVNMYVWLGDSALRTERYLRVKVRSTAPLLPSDYAGDPFLRASRFIACKAWRPANHFRAGYSVQVAAESPRVALTLGQNTRVLPSPRKTETEIVLHGLSRSEALGDAWDFDELHGASVAAMVVMSPDGGPAADQREIFYGLMRWRSHREIGPNSFDKPLTIENLT